MSDNLDEPNYDWVTASGQKLRYSEMTSVHIKNCIKMLEHQLSERPLDYEPNSSDSDGAYWAMLSEVRHNERVASSLEKTIRELEQELERRGDE